MLQSKQRKALQVDDIVTMYFWKRDEGLTHKQIGDRLHISEHTVTGSFSYLKKHWMPIPGAKMVTNYDRAAKLIKGRIMNEAREAKKENAKIADMPITQNTPQQRQEIEEDIRDIEPERYVNLRNAFEILQNSIMEFVEKEVEAQNLELIAENTRLKDELETLQLQQKNDWVKSLQNKWKKS